MQSGQNHPILSWYPDDYPDKNPAPRSLTVPPCHVFMVRWLGQIFAFQTHCVQHFLTFSFHSQSIFMWIMEQNCEFLPIQTNLEHQKIGTLLLSRQNLTKSGSLCPDINGSPPSGFLTCIRGSCVGSCTEHLVGVWILVHMAYVNEIQWNWSSIDDTASSACNVRKFYIVMVS